MISIVIPSSSQSNQQRHPSMPVCHSRLDSIVLQRALLPPIFYYRFTILTRIVAEDYKTTRRNELSYSARQIFPQFDVAVIKTQKVLVVATVQFTDRAIISTSIACAVDGAGQ
jgi:hypothetical protein